MKFLIHSNAPTIATGYGVQTALLSQRLLAAGHDVAVSCTYGHYGTPVKWRGVTLYPAGYEVNSNDVICDHALHFFDGDPKGGWIIPLLDVWCLLNPVLAEFQVAAWAPVDHFPVPPKVLDFFHRTGATPIAMSRFGEDMFHQAGLSPVFVPLAVDTTVFKPTPTLEVGGQQVNARDLFGLNVDAFVVGMVGMNKGWARDRKGFNEAFRAFAWFWKSHPNAVLFMHTEQLGGADGFDLVELARHAGIPPHALVWSNQYAYRLGLPAEMMAAAYTAMDVLLAPSHGEGFCVPLIEAQACGTPVIASRFSAQPELVGAGWLVDGQLEWDPAQKASYLCPFTADIASKLELAYNADLVAMQTDAIGFASGYDADKVFAGYWQPFLKTLEPVTPVVKPRMERIDVIVPAMRPANSDRLLQSHGNSTGWTNILGDIIIVSDGEWRGAMKSDSSPIDTGKDHTTFAEKVNLGLQHSMADWVLVVGDDVEFTPGWYEALRELSDRFDVIGTNDSEEGRVRNPDVAAGRHADHFAVRRSYIDELGASLDGPGVLAPECYRHWYTDKEIVSLAQARGVYGHAHDCRIIHHHPGYDGDESARQADPVYMKAVESAETDRKTFMSRVPLIEGHRVTRAKP